MEARSHGRWHAAKPLQLPLAALAVVLMIAGAVRLAAQAPAASPPPGPAANPPLPAPSVPPGQAVPGEPAGKPAVSPSVFVVLDPAHGGADNGARAIAEEGAVEKDLVLAIAQAMRHEMERQGARVLLTRQADVALSIDDRAALANAAAQGFFVTLHVASTGDPNTAMAYSFGAPQGGAPPLVLPRPAGFFALRWEDAQNGYLVASRRLAELLQVELAQKLPGSADVPQFAEVRQLRVVARPAVAIELSSVAEADAPSLTRTAIPLANALLRAIAAYRQSGGARP